MSEPTLFFVLGAPKSGTTWLEAALNAHPAIVCKGEGKFHFFRNQLVSGAKTYNSFLKQRMQRIFGRETFPPIDRDELDAVFHAFVEGRIRKGGPWPGVARIGAKDPDFGLYIAEFAAGFPRADYLHIIRDPRDAALSMWHHMKRVHPEVSQGEQGATMADTALGWRHYIEGVREEADRLGLSYTEIRYEDMIAAPEATLARAFTFLKVAGDTATIADCVSRSRFEVLSGGRSAGSEDRASFFRKGLAGGWRDELTEPQVDAIMAAAGPLAHSLGYR